MKYNKMRTFHVLGILLAYPSQSNIDTFAECRYILCREKKISTNMLDKIEQLMDWIMTQDLLDAQEEYVSLFDRTPSLDLHLFEHVHGDSRDRGQALVDLMKTYEKQGLALDTEESPDYLPLFLEYLSLIELSQACADLEKVVDVLGMLKQRLEKRQSLYAAIFQTLITLSPRQPDATALVNAEKVADAGPLNMQQIDRLWEEQYAFAKSTLEMGGDSRNECPKVQTMMDRIKSSLQPKE